MPRKEARSRTTEAFPKHYLKVVLPKSKIEILFGPIHADNLVGYYYDSLAEYIKKGGEIDSVALKDAKVKKMGLPIYAMSVWNEWREAYTEGKIPSGRVEEEDQAPVHL